MSQVKVNCTSCQSRMRMQQLQKIGGVLKVRRAFAGHERVAFSQVGRLGHESRSPCQESRRSCKLCFQSHARHDLTGHRTFAGIFWLRCLTLRAMGCCVSCSPACQVIDRSPPASRVWIASIHVFLFAHDFYTYLALAGQLKTSICTEEVRAKSQGMVKKWFHLQVLAMKVCEGRL